MPPVTTALIVANIAVYFLQSIAPGIEMSLALWPVGASRASGGQVSFEVWQVVTYGFLHGGMLHLAFNMFALYMFGSAFELVVGPKRYLNYYLVCIIFAALTQLVVTRITGAWYPTVGASGGVFGLLLAYAIYFPRSKVMLLFPPIPIPSRLFVVIYAAVELFLGVRGSQSGVAHFAHLGGLIGGAAMLWYWRSFSGRR